MRIERIVRGGMDREVARFSCWSTRQRFLWPTRDRLKWKSARRDGGLVRVARWRRCLYSKLRNLIPGTFKRIENREPHHLRQTLSLSWVSFYLTSSSHVNSIFQITRAIFSIFLTPYLVRLTRELIIGCVRGWSTVNVSKRPQRVWFLCKDSQRLRFLIKRGNVPFQINSTRRLVGFDFGSVW